METPGASRCVLEETGEGREIAHSWFSVAFISGESETKPIKPINHEQPTNWRLSISTTLLITSLAKAS